MNTTIILQSCLDRFNSGDPQAKEQLVNRACQRLTRLANRMFDDYPGLRRWVESEDVLQSACIRLCRALEAVQPESVADFFGLAALAIRRELLDLSRHYARRVRGRGEGVERGRCFHVRSSDAAVLEPPASVCADPHRMAVWTELHEQIALLPACERQVTELLWYNGLTQLEAAQVLQVSLRSVKRYWQAARLRLYDALDQERLI